MYHLSPVHNGADKLNEPYDCTLVGVERAQCIVITSCNTRHFSFRGQIRYGIKTSSAVVPFQGPGSDDGLYRCLVGVMKDHILRRIARPITSRYQALWSTGRARTATTGCTIRNSAEAIEL